MDAPHAAYRLLSVYNPALQLDCKETFANESLRFYDPSVDLTTITPDVAALRALGHPVRLRILGLLRADGPATATALAQRLGLNSGATSYHLRQLAAHSDNAPGRKTDPGARFDWPRVLLDLASLP